MAKSRAINGLAALIITAVAACETGVLAPSGGPLAAVQIAPQPAVVEETLTLQLQATLLDPEGNPLNGRKVFWSSEDASIATVSATGVVTGITSGSTRVAASSEGVTAIATVSVVSRVVAAIGIAPLRLDLVSGEAAQLNAVARDREDRAVEGRPVLWSSSDSEIVTVDSSGRVVAVAPGAATVSATIDAVSASIPVTVAAPAVASVEIVPREATLTVGSDQQLAATPRAANGTALPGREVFWSSTNPAVATVSAEGLVHAVAPGAASISALVEGRTGTANVAVSVTPVAEVRLTVPDTVITVGSTRQLVAVATAADGTPLENRVIAWSSSAPTVASISSTGILTALTVGEVTIAASSEGKSSSVTLRVASGLVATMEISPSAVQLIVGGTQQLVASPRDASGNLLINRPTVWSSSDPTVASVNASGVVTAVATGGATITATVEDRSASATVDVSAVPVASVEISPTSAAITVGATRQFSATTRSADGTILTGRTIAWASSDPAVATVDATGLATATGIGQATITATSEGQSASATVSVSAVPVASVVISPTSAALAVGGTQQFSATARAEDGSVLADRPISWSSSNPLVATVDESGLVIALTPGKTTITATSEGKSGSAEVTVSVAPAATVAVAPASVTLAGTTSVSWTLGAGPVGERRAWATVAGLPAAEFVAVRL